MNETQTGGGAAVRGNVDTGGDFAGRDRMASNIHFSSQDNARIWEQLIALGDKISQVNIRLDDLPDRVKILEVRILNQSATSTNLSVGALYWIIGLGLTMITVLSSVQVILQVSQ